MDKVFNTVMSVLIDHGEDIPDIEQINANTIKITQNFMPAILTKVE
jgi:hypothetical protein